MPARAWRSGGAWVTSSPRKTMRPVVGAVSPARQLKNVDFPAPFGPIKPTISPSSTSRSAPATARNAPKALETPVASSSMSAPPALRHGAMPQVENATRLESGDDDNDAAVKDVGEARAAAPEQRVGRRLQRDQDQRADQRAEQGAGAAKRRDDHHLHRNQDAEATVGIDKTGLNDIERAGNRGEGSGQRQRLQFRLPHRHAEAPRRAFAGLDGAQIEAEAAAFERGSDGEQHAEHGKKDVVVWQLAAERQVPPAAAGRRALQADRRADEGPGAGEDADQFGYRNGRHAEIMPGEPERRHADHDSECDGEHDAGRDAGERRPAPQVVEQQRRVGAEPEEHAVADRDLSGITANDVPGRRGDRREQEGHADIAIERSCERKRIKQQPRRQNDQAESRRENILHALPISPCGRNHSKATNKP